MATPITVPVGSFKLQSISYAGSTITLHFDRAVSAGNGNFVISDGYAQSYMGINGLSTRIVGATDVHKLDDSDPQISYNGQDVVITLTSPLKAGVNYSVTMESGAVVDGSNGANYAITSPKLFPFTASGTASTPPATPAAVVAPAIHFTDTGDSSDYITAARDQQLSGSYTGTLGANDFIQVSLDNGASWHKATAGADNSWSYNGVIDTTNLRQGEAGIFNGTLLARVSNTTGGSSATASHDYVYSNQSIKVYLGEGFSFSLDTGVNSNDRITNTADQTVSGSYSGTLLSGQKLQVSMDNGITWANASAANGSWQLDVTLLNGANYIQARVIDVAGNTSGVASSYYQLKTSTVSLAGHELALVNGSDTGISSTDGITKYIEALTLNVAGLHGFAAGDTIEIVDTSNGSVVVGRYVVESGDLYLGNDYFSNGYDDPTPRDTINISLNGSLNEGAHSLQARVVDRAGNVAASSVSANITVDTQAFSSDTLTGNHFIETHTSISGTLTADAAITDQIVEVTFDHGASWQQATLVKTDTTHATWSLAGLDLEQAVEYGVRIADKAGNITGAAYYMTSRDIGYYHPEYDDIVLYAGGGINPITVGARATVDGGGGYGDQITTGDDAHVVVGNDSKVVTANGSNFVSTGFGADITTGNGNDTISCSSIDYVKIRAGLGNDTLTVRSLVTGLTLGLNGMDVQGVEALHFGDSGANELTINSGIAVRTFSDAGKLTITAAASGSHIHLSALWVSDGAQGDYHAYHTSSGEILLIGQNIAVDVAQG
ncbi:Ig-like domain-containing protein [Duganella sp. sic0402]|uniref:Ig-like domain-containing protein n=1 Tax=Duganella sp. sic0402 TaxID=2854786 RepID=UPI001C490EF7|nr:Ig-like domain-containing protein [Duganella sp. sic0402]MBV7538011.1 Ig-like domain-containing protein [Duganella sp. sic0402]